MITQQQSKRVCFQEGAAFSVVHLIEPLEDDQIQDMFYLAEDYVRFRYERNIEIERHLRKQMQQKSSMPSRRRQSRRSSIDVMQSKIVTTSTVVADLGYGEEDPASSMPLPSGASQPRRSTRRSSIDMMQEQQQQYQDHKQSHHHHHRRHHTPSPEHSSGDGISMPPLPTFRRATRRSSIDLMMTGAPNHHSAPHQYQQQMQSAGRRTGQQIALAA